MSHRRHVPVWKAAMALVVHLAHAVLAQTGRRKAGFQRRAWVALC